MNKLSLTFALALCLLIGGSFAPIFNPGGGSGGSGSITVAEEDGNPSVATVSTLKFANGSLTDNGSGSVSVSFPATPTIQAVFAVGAEITGANSLANALKVGDGVTPICLYTDATLGPAIQPCTPAATKTLILTNQTHSLYDQEGALAMETYDPDAASTLLIWTYPNAAYRPKKSIYFDAGALSTDGAQCAAPAEVTLGSGPKTWTIICTENAASAMYGKVKLPDSYDGGTMTVEAIFVQTAADTGTIKLDASSQCRGTGEAVSATWGTAVDIDVTGTGSNKNDFGTSAAMTPAGTCAAGDMFYLRVLVDAANNPTTAAATLNFLGFKVEYSISSRSD